MKIMNTPARPIMDENDDIFRRARQRLGTNDPSQITPEFPLQYAFCLLDFAQEDFRSGELHDHTYFKSLEQKARTAVEYAASYGASPQEFQRLLMSRPGHLTPESYYYRILYDAWASGGGAPLPEKTLAEPSAELFDTLLRNRRGALRRFFAKLTSRHQSRSLF